MPPRKSLPAARATPNHPIPKRGQSSTPAARMKRAELPRKRQRRNEPVEDDLESIEQDQDQDQVATNAAAPEPDHNEEGLMAGPVSLGVMDQEKELEHWQDFTVEHYEMVEQLPLELHRNYRLLRELDDGVAVHAEKLQSAIREYIVYRLDEPQKSNPPPSTPPEVPPLPSITLEAGQRGEEPAGAAPEAEPISVMDNAVPIPDGLGGQIMPPPEAVDVIMADAVGEVTHDTTTTKTPLPTNGDFQTLGTSNGIADGETQATGEADAEAEAENEIIEVEQVIAEDQGRRPFPSVSPAAPEADVLPPQALRQDKPESSRVGARGRGSRKWELLPEIARLARDMVKNGEEKVAVAQGAYNSIDRHIRALDSALSSQEASILLGLRPSTLPSTAVEEALDTGEEGALPDGDEIVLGTGGGGARRKGRAQRGRARKGVQRDDGKEETNGLSDVAAAGAGAGAGDLASALLDANPNEPRYCYCNQVSYGQMIGCDNDDCQIEWFHLECAGLTSAPTGEWLCNICKAESRGKDKGGATAPARAKARGARGRGRGKARARHSIR